MSFEILEKHYQDQPFEVSLETFAVCNANCRFCPYETIERKGTKMEDSVIDRVIDELATFGKPFYFSPFKVSDPLLDKRLYTILKKLNAKAPLGRVRIFTNGSALTLKKAEELNDIENLELFISLNEHREKEYKDLMQLDYHKTIKNIDQLHETNFRHPVTVLRVGVEPEFKAFAEKRWRYFRVIMVKKDGWLGYTQADEYTPPEKCGRWYELSIMSTGKVSLCCMDAEGKYSVGDINENTLLEIYNGQYKQYRESNRNLTPCKDCTY